MAFILLAGLAVGGVAALSGFLSGPKTVAKNISEETIKGLITISNKATQKCIQDASQIQEVIISGNNKSNIVVNNDWTQQLLLTTNCVQNVSFNNDIGQAMAQEAQQLAKAISQQFQLASAKASNLSRATAELSINVSNAFVQECISSESQEQIAILKNNTKSDINVFNNWQQYNMSTFDCVMKDSAVTNARQKVDQITTQQATATVENFMAGIIGAIFAVFAIIGLIIFAIFFFRSGTSPVTNTPTKIQNTQEQTDIELQEIQKILKK